MQPPPPPPPVEFAFRGGFKRAVSFSDGRNDLPTAIRGPPPPRVAHSTPLGLLYLQLPGLLRRAAGSVVAPGFVVLPRPSGAGLFRGGLYAVGRVPGTAPKSARESPSFITICQYCAGLEVPDCRSLVGIYRHEAMMASSAKIACCRPVGRIFRASRLALLPASARRVLPSVCVAPLPRCLSPRIERHRGLFPRVATDLLVTHLTCLPLARA